MTSTAVIRASGTTRAEAFAQATLGVFALIVALDDVVERETREVRAQADSPEHLLVSWVNECLYVHEIEGFVARRVEVSMTSGDVAVGTLHGEAIDPGRHRLGTLVKAATLHEVLVSEASGRHEVRLTVDV